MRSLVSFLADFSQGVPCVSIQLTLTQGVHPLRDGTMPQANLTPPLGFRPLLLHYCLLCVPKSMRNPCHAEYNCSRISSPPLYAHRDREDLRCARHIQDDVDEEDLDHAGQTIYIT